MQNFCVQNLKEFDASENFETLVENTLWWENFNAQNPNFILKEMATYHYKNWHLKNLLLGTNKIIVFTEQGNLSKKAYDTYRELIEKYPVSETAKTLKMYLDILEQSGMKKTTALDEFLSQHQ